MGFRRTTKNTRKLTLAAGYNCCATVSSSCLESLWWASDWTCCASVKLLGGGLAIQVRGGKHGLFVPMGPCRLGFSLRPILLKAKRHFGQLSHAKFFLSSQSGNCYYNFGFGAGGTRQPETPNVHIWPQPSGPHPSRQNFFWVWWEPPLRGPTSSPMGTHTHQIQKWRGQNWIRQNRKVGLFQGREGERMLDFDQFRLGPIRITCPEPYTLKPEPKTRNLKT